MIEVLAVHRANQGDVVGVLRDVRQGLGYVHAALAVASKLEG